MSRVDQALRRASEGTSPKLADAEHGEEPDNAGLHLYPRESGSAGIPLESLAPEPRSAIVTPRLRERRPFGTRQVAAERTLVVNERANPLAVVQYRRLAGALHDLQAAQGLKTVMVTSALPNDGKTLTVANLALTLSESFARRVLLIDGDLRRPSVHTLFKLRNERGLSDVLLSESEDLPLQQLSANLSVLPAGRSDLNAMAAVTSDRMEDLIDKRVDQFDWVLLDAAPVPFMPDARLLARIIGAVLFVIAAGSTPYPLVDKAMAALGPESVIGTVLNRVANEAIPGATVLSAQ
jgi:protein-tyrosine kinase